MLINLGLVALGLASVFAFVWPLFRKKELTSDTALRSYGWLTGVWIALSMRGFTQEHGEGFFYEFYSALFWTPAILLIGAMAGFLALSIRSRERIARHRKNILHSLLSIPLILAFLLGAYFLPGSYEYVSPHPLWLPLFPLACIFWLFALCTELYYKAHLNRSANKYEKAATWSERSAFVVLATYMLVILMVNLF